MAEWIKIVGGSKTSPYTQAAHDSWDRRHVWFPGTGTSVSAGDRLFLYTGHPLRRFFCICRVLEAPSVSINAREGLHLRCRVQTQLTISDLTAHGVRAEAVFPLPGGATGVSLRQKSHLRIEGNDAVRLITHLMAALARELAADAPIQRSLFPDERI
ncbi:MAG: hypothetical protein R6U70_01270 [Bacillota bacterium]